MKKIINELKDMFDWNIKITDIITFLTMLIALNIYYLLFYIIAN